MTVASPAELLRALRQFGLDNDRLDAVAAHAVGVGPTELKAMDHIHAEGDLTPGQLGDRLALSSGAVTALIDRLERLGWVKRDPNPGDRRSVVVRPTSETGRKAEAIYGPLERALAAAASRMTPEERAACVAFLEAATKIAAQRATELRGSGPAPTRSPAPDSPPTPGA